MHSESSAHFSEKNLGQRLLRNTAALAFGSNLNSIGRLVIAGLIVRSLGTSVFGEYSLLIVWTTIAEWILDFGTTDVFVREANQTQERRGHLLRILLALKAIQAPTALLLLFAGLMAMHYPQPVVIAGMVAGISLLFLAVAAVCRAAFKATLTMGREVVADSASVISMLFLVPFVASSNWGLLGLMTAYVVSRAIFLAVCLLLSRDLVHLSVRGVSLADIRWGISSSSAIGAIGFVVVAYSATDLLALSRMANAADVAVYSAAQRFATPLMMALNSVAVSVYPVLAAQKDPVRFRQTCQRAVDTIVLLGGIALAGLWCGSEFFMGLLGHDFIYGADALRILAAACVVKGISTVIGPVLFLVRAQRYALVFTIGALVAKVAVMAVATPRFGYMGAAAGTLWVEAFFLMPLTLYFVHSFTGFTIRFSGILRVAMVVFGVVVVTRAVLPEGTFLAAVVASGLYAAAVFALRMVQVSDLKALLRKGDSGSGAVSA